ncbi:MAG TPA: hypothetical protein VER96_00960 [Polyangiaceae bacterium]|nr:hypothetical protein [Polyangiaceae bacterium]
MSFASLASAQSTAPTLHTTPGPAPAPAAAPAPATAPAATAPGATAPATPPATTDAAPPPVTDYPTPTDAEGPAPASTEYNSTEPAAPLQQEAPEAPAPRGPFSKGSVRLTVVLGTASTTNDNYFIIGAGLGYYIVNGLEVGLDYEAWLFAKPVMQRLSPEARYVFHMVPVVKPFAGVFYRRNFVTDYDDYNQIGTRLGAYFIPKSNRMFVGAAAVYEKTLDCTSGGYIDCDEWYPEITIGVSL